MSQSLRALSLILSILSTQQIFGQDKPEILLKKASNFYSESKNIDSALNYYIRLQNEYPAYRSGYITYQIGSCFLIKKDQTRARGFLIKSLPLRDSFESYPESACLKIADIFFQQREFQLALNYYDSSTSFYKIRDKYGTRHRYKEGNIETIYKKAICFERLNRLDTAISILTPRMFMSFEDYPFDSSEVEELSDFYISLLRKKYTDKEIKKEFKKSMNALIYKKEVDTSFYNKNANLKSIDILCYFYFFGKEVNIFYTGISVRNIDEERSIGWTKKEILEDFYKTPTYKKLKSI